MNEREAIAKDWERISAVAMTMSGSGGAACIALWASINVPKLLQVDHLTTDKEDEG